MNDKPKYVVLGFYTADDVNSGCDAESEADTLKEAKARARYMISEQARLDNEASKRLQRAQVWRGNECVVDYSL